MTAHHESAVPDFQKRYDVLLDIARILTGTLEADELYRAIYEQASRVLETTGFYVSLYDAASDLATVVFYADRGEIERPDTTYRGSESTAIRQAHPVLENVLHPDDAIMLLGPEQDEEVTRSIIAAPLLHEGVVLGVISAQSYRSRAYTEDDLELLAALADLAAVAIYNARTVQELELRRRESEQLEAVSRALTSSLELTEVLQGIMDAIKELGQADGAAVWLLHQDGQAEIAMTTGDLALPEGTTFPVPDTLHRALTSDGAPITFDFREPEPIIPEEIRNLIRTETGIVIPMKVGDELIGALSVAHASARTYPPEDVRLLERFALHAAIAVSNARLHEQVRFLSLTDPLTELPNRRHMQIFLEKEFAAAERGRSLTVILYDLDDFKVFNDTAGHQAGDEALRRFGRILATETRAMNLVARYGGDEFIAILSDTSLEGGALSIRRVLTAVEADDVLKEVGVSAGMATYTPEMSSAAELIRRADKALYREKSQRPRLSQDG